MLESVKKQAPNFFRSIKDGFAGFGNEPPVPEAASTATDSTGTASDTLSNITETNTEESIPSNVETGKKRGSHWVSIAVCTGVTLIGSVMTIIGNTLAKDAAERGGQTLSRLEDNRDDAETGQTLRGIGIGLALVGAVSLTLSLSF